MSLKILKNLLRQENVKIISIWLEFQASKIIPYEVTKKNCFVGNPFHVNC